MIEHALDFLSRGWAPLALQPRGKKPLITGWNRFSERLPEEDTVRGWWDRWPDANVGLVCGEASGLLVLDVDPRHGGYDSLSGREIPPTLSSLTGSGGVHLYFQSPGCFGNRVGVLPGLDVRAQGGQVVAPPSTHPSGKPYRWRDPEILLADAPSWLVDMLATFHKTISIQNATDAKPSRATLEFLALGAAEGERNDRLFRASCDMAGCGADEEAKPQLLEAALKAGLSEAEANETIASAFSRPRTPSRPARPLGSSPTTKDAGAANTAQTVEEAGSHTISSASSLLDEAGVTGEMKGVDAAVSALRQLEKLLLASGTDVLFRAGVREEAIVRLKAAGILSPAKLVDAALATSDEGKDTQTVWGEDPEPWPEPVEGAELLNEIEGEISRYLALPDGAAVATALWVVFSHLHDDAPVSPLLTISSPVKRCGKTTLMTILAELVPRPLPASNVSAAAVFRIVEAWCPTLLVDEADAFLRDREELRGILNSGHTRAMGFVVRCDGDDHEPRRFSTWCAKALALIGQPPDTLTDRSVVIPMRRRAPGEHTERLRTDRLDLVHLKQMTARWALDHQAVLRNDPVMPESLNDRAADNWRPLLAIADSAGGDWPENARRTAVLLTTGGGDDSATGTILLGDLKKIFSERDADKLSSEEVVSVLVKMEERPWPEWRRGQPLTQRGLARLLAPFDIQPKQLWAGGKKTRGYDRNDFKDAWVRYVVPAETGRTGRTRTSSAIQPISQPVDGGGPTASQNSQNPCGDSVLPVLPDADPEYDDEWMTV